MKLMKKITENDFKKLKSVTIREWNNYQENKSFTRTDTFLNCENTIKVITCEKWNDNPSKQHSRKSSMSAALKRINASIVFQEKPTETNIITVTCEPF